MRPLSRNRSPFIVGSADRMEGSGEIDMGSRHWGMSKWGMSKWLGCLLVLLSCFAAHAGTVTYVYTDPQGTPLAEADAQGNITARFDYASYGSVAMGAAPNGPGYTGHVNDPDTGLVYMQARYYDPVTARFLSVDPKTPLVQLQSVRICEQQPRRQHRPGWEAGSGYGKQ
jgi:RHS repeat-associated protein